MNSDLRKPARLAAVGMLLAGLLMAAVPRAQAAEEARQPVKASAKRTKAKSKKPPEPVAAEAPPAPLRPYQLPAQPPKVTFENGRLAIVADNSTLSAVLEQVGAATGAEVEASPAFGSERVSAHLGPGPPRSVLAELLNGSNYNYLLLGSVAEPESLEKIVVSPRGAPPAAALSTAPAPTRIFPVIVRKPSQAQQPDEETETVPEPDEAQDELQPVPAEPQPAGPQVTPAPGQPGQPGGPPGTPAQPPAVKTPQELLQELQERMRRNQEERDRQREQQGEEPE